MLEKNNRTAMKLAWSFFKGNYALNFATIAILIVLTLLGAIPLLGIIFVFAYSIVSLSVQIFYGRLVPSVESVEEMESVAKDIKIGDFLSRYIHVAAGGFLALFFISIVFMMLFGIVVKMGGGASIEHIGGGVMTQAQMVSMMAMVSVPSLIILLVGAFLFYFFPAVMGKVILSEDFASAFKTVFYLFNPNLWKQTFNKEYFILVFIWSLILIGVGIVMVVLSASLVLIPVVLIIAYLVSLYNSGVYVFSVDLLKE